MWNTALTINSLVWVMLGTFLVYSIGPLFLLGEWHQFVYTAILWVVCTFAGAFMATQN